SRPSRRPPAPPADRRLRVNDLQVIGTHNSYHLRSSTLFLGGSVDFAHAPLDLQLEEQGVRSLELDAYNGPDFPVEHSPVLDSATSCTPLAACLEAVERWSHHHPRHALGVSLRVP